jgi:hypothetical protein
MEIKIIIGILVALALVGGVVGCNYIVNNPTQPATTNNVVQATEPAVQQNTQSPTTQDPPKVQDKKTTTVNAQEQTCTKCSGKGYIKCGACGGSGCTYTDCPNCDSGKVSVEGMVKIACHTEDCTACGGSGKIKASCKACGGDGKILCSHCGGDGIIN